MAGSPLEKDDEDAKDERALGHVLGMAVKSPKTWGLISALLLGGGTWREFTRNTPEPVEAFSPAEMRQMMKAEIAPLRAGIEELAKAESPKVQVAVLTAMMKAERRNAEGQ